MNSSLEKAIENLKSDLYSARNSTQPLLNEIKRKIYWLDMLFFQNSTFKHNIDIDYVKEVTDALEISSDLNMKSSRSQITYYIPSSCNISEELSPSNYFIINNEDNYFFRIYSNNTIDIDTRLILSRNKPVNDYTVRDCFIFLIYILSILKHLQMFNRYLFYNSRIHWNYNKPTDNMLDYMYNAKNNLKDIKDLKHDFINIIIDSTNMINYNFDLNYSVHSNSIRSFKFLFYINNDNRHKIASEYDKKISNSRSKLFKVFYNIRARGETQKRIENTYNTLLFSKLNLEIAIAPPLRLVIVAKQDVDRVKFLIIKNQGNEYLYIVTKGGRSIFIDSRTGLAVHEEKILHELKFLIPIHITWK